MGSQSSRRPVTTQVASWVVNVLTEMLDVDERQIVRGDVAESGVTGIGYLGWYGLVFPAGTPQPIVDKLHKAMQEVLAKDAVKKRFEDIGAAANLSSPAEFRKVILSDIKGFQEVARTAGLEPK